jgi:co-chaperonin GroES (HSP10)
MSPHENLPANSIEENYLPHRSPIIKRDQEYFDIVCKSWDEYDLTFKKQDEVMKQQLGGVIPIKGYKILLKTIELPEQTDSGLYIPETATGDYLTSPVGTIGIVIGIGPEAYKDPAQFPYGPRCKVGDLVDFSAYEKEKRIYGGHKCHIINDDRINFPMPDITLIAPMLQKSLRKAQEELRALGLGV